MTSFRTFVGGLCVLASLLLATPAAAQESRFTASVNFGAQGGSGDFTQRLTPTIYDEPASISVGQTYESGPLFDIGGNYLVFGNIGVGVSYSHTAGDGNAVLAGEIPDQIVFDRPRSATATAEGLDHKEDAVHLTVTYRFAASPKLDITLGIGPTFFSVKQQLVDTVTVTETAGGPSMTPQVVEASDSPVGINVGADVTYMVTKTFGAGVLLRYAGGSADLSTPSGASLSLDAGGFQFGAGVRVRF